jgi:uncharacterized membrane protein
MGKKEEKIFNRSSGTSRASANRLGYWVVVLAACFLVGCTTIKKAGITSLSAGAGALAGTVLSGGVAAPILGATTTAFVADVVTEAIPIGQAGKKAMSNCAPDNFWTLLGSLAEMGGWLLILVVIIPMVLGWFLPGPVKLKGKDKPQINPYLK